MFELFTIEAVLSLTITCLSVMAITGIMLALNASKRETQKIDIKHVVRKAPYHRLHNIIPHNRD